MFENYESCPKLRMNGYVRHHGFKNPGHICLDMLVDEAGIQPRTGARKGGSPAGKIFGRSMIGSMR